MLNVTKKYRKFIFLIELIKLGNSQIKYNKI